jgi:DNA-binding response OmpR family regulator
MSNILLIEPNQLLASQYAAVLQRGGHDVKICASGQQGIERADSVKPDLLVLELLLPAHSGVEFLYEFRSYSDWREVPAVILTTLPRGELNLDEIALKKLGVSTYLYKPETPLAKLLRAANRALMVAPKNI